MKRIAIAAAVTLGLAACAGTGYESPTAAVKLEPRSGSQVRGSLTLTQVAPDRVRIAGEVAGHSPGPKGFHIHDKGDCSAPDAMSAGGHFNPGGSKHGGLTGARHAGDIGNIVFDASGKATVNVVAEGITLTQGAANNVVGRAVVVHAAADDLKTDPTGNSGGRVACGVIQ
jgi:superoxide dismutase, Cu-Zn family